MKAGCATATPDMIWQHFINAIAPAIKTWQLNDITSDKAESSSLGKLLDEALQYASQSNEEMSEVCI